jgi:hypothetical protein
VGPGTMTVSLFIGATGNSETCVAIVFPVSSNLTFELWPPLSFHSSRRKLATLGMKLLSHMRAGTAVLPL